MATSTDAVDRIAEDPVATAQMDIVGCCRRDFRASRLDDSYLQGGTALSRPLRLGGRHVLMSAADIQAGKAGFQKADLMDYGSLYGMGSYFGEDYTAANLVRLATLTEDNIAKAERQSTRGLDGR